MLWLKRSLGILSVFLLAVVIIGLILPSKVRVERKIIIDARPQAIYSQIDNFKKWERWSPWAKIDPEAEFKIVGRGLQQKMIWSSDDPRVGEGSQQFVLLNAPEHIKTHLDFGKQGIADASFDLVGVDGKTEVTWSLDTDMREGIPIYLKPFSAYLGFFMDAMVGKDYETGLKNLQAVVEK